MTRRNPRKAPQGLQGHFPLHIPQLPPGSPLQHLKEQGIEIFAHIKSIGNISDTAFDKVNVGEAQQKRLKESSFPVLNSACGEKMNSAILQAKNEGDSLGGVIDCTVEGLPIGLGEPFWDSVESLISHAVFSIPGVRGIEFGDGFKAARMKGSEHNDPFGPEGLLKNGAGGVNGGLTNGAPLVFRVAFKPTSSIAKPQQTYNFKSQSMETLCVTGRHDVCFALRTPVIVEAMTAIVLADLI